MGNDKKTHDIKIKREKSPSNRRARSKEKGETTKDRSGGTFRSIKIESDEQCNAPRIRRHQ